MRTDRHRPIFRYYRLVYILLFDFIAGLMTAINTTASPRHANVALSPS